MAKFLHFSLIATSIMGLGLIDRAIATPSLIRLGYVEIAQQMRTLPRWQTDGDRLYCTVQFSNFVESVDFVNRLLPVAEAAAHHPDLTINYSKLTISLTTHDAGGLTVQDFDLARLITGLPGGNCQL